MQRLHNPLAPKTESPVLVAGFFFVPQRYKQRVFPAVFPTFCARRRSRSSLIMPTALAPANHICRMVASGGGC